MRGRPYRPTALVFLFLVAGAGSPRAESPPPVRVAIWEDLPEPWGWKVAGGEPERGPELRPSTPIRSDLFAR